MKKIILTMIVACCTLAANAQVWLGGSLGLSVTDPEQGDAITSIVIAPEIGYNINEKWGVGVSLEETAVMTDGNNVNAFYFNPFARYSFARTGIANFFIDGGLQIGFQNFDSNYVKTDSHTAFGIGIRPGVKVELNKKWALEAKTGYLGCRVISDVATQIGLGVNNEDLSFGLVYEF